MTLQKNLTVKMKTLTEQIEHQINPSNRWRDSLISTLAVAIGGILNWSANHIITESVENSENGAIANQIDLIATKGIVTSLEAITKNLGEVAFRLVMEGSWKNQSTPQHEIINLEGKGKQITILVDPIDGTRNVLDGRIFNAATVAAASKPMPIGQNPTFNDVNVAITCYLTITRNYQVVIECILATPSNIWKIQIEPKKGTLVNLSAFNPKPRRFQELVFSTYSVAHPNLTEIKERILEAGFQVVPGCGASALDCLRILQLEKGAYIDLRARYTHPNSKLHTYDIAAVPFTATAFAKATGSNIKVLTAGITKTNLTAEHTKRHPLNIAPLSLILTKDMDHHMLSQLIKAKR